MNFCGSFQELDHFLQFIFGFINPGHIIKGDGGMFPTEHSRLRLAKGHGGVITALRLAEDEPEQNGE